MRSCCGHDDRLFLFLFLLLLVQMERQQITWEAAAAVAAQQQSQDVICTTEMLLNVKVKQIKERITAEREEKFAFPSSKGALPLRRRSR